jgi:hypothetical protein
MAVSSRGDDRWVGKSTAAGGEKQASPGLFLREARRNSLHFNGFVFPRAGIGWKRAHSEKNSRAKLLPCQREEQSGKNLLDFTSSRMYIFRRHFFEGSRRLRAFPPKT